ncbi:FHF complex subunit HOOK interacting protein 1A-like [Xyrauchen texanus]|uniref:FHF complex subunit HOOK interacting protein 1A-like n=1 Tax=Xyrauchen texanus TaxID=154827 RepID=UPI0022429DC3|nr:FHF complex subunit HOOK interacting protein 1A-like [Xyrauchen texanus]
MASMLANGIQGDQSLVLKGVDPETCMIVFKNHWAQVVKILGKHDPLRINVGGLGGSHNLGGGGVLGSLLFGPIPGDEASTVQNYVEQMLFLLMKEECGQSGAMGPILVFVVMENVLERLFIWSLRRQFTDNMKLEQLKMYEMLIGQARQSLLHLKPVLRPLMMLLSSCSGSLSGPSSSAVDAELVLLLNQLCCVLAKDPSILELFFHTSEDQGAANFLIFSLLIPFIHREGLVGQQARDALLLIMALSAENHVVAKHIAENTYFCPVLATGLSGLYSSLPTKLNVPAEDWHCLHREDWLELPALVQFLNPLEFCNAVIQVANTSIREQLVGYIHNGFLVPVLAPALHKLTLEEVMTTTAYLDLFIRSVSEPALLHTFLRFILLHRHDNVHILDTLVSRINTPFQLGTVSLALFRTLIGFYCEDVMLQLIFKYLIPCNHMMLSQRRVLRERDCYSLSAAKFLALTPSCCSPEIIPPPLRQLDSILWSKGTAGAHTGTMESEVVLSEEDDCGHTCAIGSEIYLDVSYLHYLYDARNSIKNCTRACRVWSAPYDGENPPSEEYQPEEAGRIRTSITSRNTPHQNKMHHSGPPHRAAAPGLLELEWDDSYDACPTQYQTEENLEANPIAEEPPKHIQELQRSAVMLVKGSYVEESEFQNDVMVYDLVAQKDVNDSGNSCHVPLKLSEESKLEEIGEPIAYQKTHNSDSSMSNGLSTPLDNTESKKRGGVPAQSDHKSVAPDGEDLMAQYEELLRTLGTQSSSQLKAYREPSSPTNLMDDEEDEVDFNSFSPETPEAENLPSPLGTKPHCGSRGHAVPFTGPFVSVLLSHLENMLNNSLQVNLLLTGILAQLSAYPQPLLCSFLLNSNMVFQPSVQPSVLYQVLASLKNQIEELSATQKDFPDLLTAAQHCLLARESSLRDQDSVGPQIGDHLYVCEADRTKKNPAIQPKTVVSTNRTEVYATVLFTEFLKELAAIAQEHSVLSHLSIEE